jgi:hypothetical protein
MILIFSIAMVANYLFYVKTIETHAHAFLTLNILAIDRVIEVISYVNKGPSMSFYPDFIWV